MTDTPIYDATGAGADTTPTPVNAMPNLGADVEAVINARLADVETKYAARIQQLEEQLAARNIQPGSGLTEHAAGPGYEVSETWGLRDQELARS